MEQIADHHVPVCAPVGVTQHAVDALQDVLDALDLVDRIAVPHELAIIAEPVVKDAQLAKENVLVFVLDA